MSKRALVLGGGGPVGIAWEAGVLLGLAEAGVDLGRVDHVIGTSAGAFVGARVALGHSPREIAAPYARREPPSAPAPRAPSQIASVSPDTAGLARLFQMIQEGARAGRSGADIARQVGAFALAAKTTSEEEFIARFVPHLRADGAGVWPSRSFVCTAFEAHDGSFKIWDADAHVDLACAVASSCAVPGVFPAVTIGGRRYFDGGVLSPTNAHLARGYDAVVVLAVTEVLMRFGNVSREKKTPLGRELEALRDGGARVEVIELDTDALQMIGPNLMDRGRQPAALHEGQRQGGAEAPRIAAALAP